ncbi:Protein of unknown function [Lachnospiraceae bacterium NE2001]|nr:Protein of unknown function [Lachnospiraceae bacterium NE2001]
MKRRLTAILVTAMMTLSLAGCGGIKVSENLKDKEDVTEDISTEATTVEVASGGDTTETASTEATTEAASEASGEDGSQGLGNDNGSSETVDFEDLLFPTQYGEMVSYGDGPFIYAKSICHYINDDDHYRLYTINEDQLFLAPGTEEQFPGIKKALDDFNSKNNLDLSYVEDDVLDMVKEQAQGYKEEGSSFNGYYNKSKAYITRVDDQVISMITYSEDYEGGVHGMYGFGGYVYDSQTGGELKLTDVVSSIDSLEEAAIQVFRRDYFEVGMMNSGVEDNIVASFDDLDLLNWSLGPTSLNLYYNPYAIASYAEGIQILRIRYEDYPDLFNKGYGASEGDWIMKLEEEYSTELYEDISGDGAVDFIRVELNNEFDEDYSLPVTSSVFIQVADEYKTFDLFSQESEVYLVKRGQRYFIDIVADEGNEENHVIHIYEVTGGNIVDWDIEYGEFSMFGEQNVYEEGYYHEIKGLFYDPDFFYMLGETYLVSSIYGYRPYKINEDGFFVPISDNYVFMYRHKLTSKVDLSVSEVNEKGEVVKGSTIPAGTDYYVVRTDDRTYADCQLDDGRLVRVIILATDSPPTVFGQSIYDVFDGVVFSD